MKSNYYHRAIVTAFALVSASLIMCQSPTRPSNTPQPAARQEELARTTWVDTSTGLRWTLHDNGSDVTWAEAKNYCRVLTVGGGGWRLPEINELKGIWAGFKEYHVKGGIKLTGYWVWSGTAGPRDTDTADYFSFDQNQVFEYPVSKHEYIRALCVRRAGK